MPIINKGVFNINSAYLREVGNDWPTAQVISTADVVEVSSNLYFTTARVLANVEQMSVNVFADVDTTGILNNGVLVWNGTKFVAGTIDTGATANTALFAEVANTVLTLSNFTTANLAEGTNLYFTNARSVGALTAGQNITIEANGRISANLTATLANISSVIDNLTTDGIAEGAVNLYYTNSRVRSTLSGGTGVIYDSSSGVISIGQNVAAEASVVFKNLTLNGNLYVLGNLVSVFANTLTISDPIIQLGYSNPGDSYDLGFVGHYNDGVQRHTGLFRDHTDGKFKLFDNLTSEPGLNDLDISNVTFRYASLVVSTLEGNVTGTVGTLSNFTTANLKESTSNLYYTNDRVVTAVIPLLTTSNVIEGTNLYFTSARVNATVQPFLTTANVIETSGNLYFTSARVNATVQPFLTTANVTETSSNLYFTTARVNATVQPFLTTANVTETSGNLYFTNARVVSALIAGQNIIIEANGRISANTTTASSLNLTTADVRETTNLYFTYARVNATVQPFLTTANVIETTGNLYFTYARVNATVQPFLTTANVIETSGNLYFTEARVNVVIQPFLTTANVIETSSNLYFTEARVNATVQPFLTTANVIETSSNLYFTNTRVVSALIAGDSITIEANGRISANISVNTSSLNLTTADVRETSNLYFTNARVFFAIAGGSSSLYVGNTTASTSKTTGALTVAGGVGISNDLTVGNSIKVDGGAYGNVITTQFASVFGAATGPNPYSIMQVRSSDDVSGIGMQAFPGSGTLYGNAVINFALAKIRDRDIPSSLVIKANIDSTGLTVFGNVNASTVQATKWSGIYTANVVETANNLYFTNTRAISAFTAGKGIVIQENGLIKTATAPAEYNLYIDGSSYGNVLSTMSTMVTMPSATATDRFIIRSIHVTNISDTTDALLSGNILYATGNTAMLVNQIPIPVGGVVDLMKRGQLLSPGDKINLQGFTSAGTATSNILSAMFTYETLAADSSYIGIGQTLATSNTNILVYDSEQAASIIESIKIVNLRDSIIPVKLYWGDANGLVKTHLAYNLPVPNNSSIELLVNPKRIEKTDRLYASYRNAENNSISVFTSARLTATFALSSYEANVIPGSAPLISIATTEAEGTVLYYTIE